ncbi:MAG TPA: hypothetical protein VIU11_08525 [Nakamurella sp.]
MPTPWALRGIVEKLTEAADRGLWAEADPELLAELAQVYLDVEGDQGAERHRMPGFIVAGRARRGLR